MMFQKGWSRRCLVRGGRCWRLQLVDLLCRCKYLLTCWLIKVWERSHPACVELWDVLWLLISCLDQLLQSSWRKMWHLLPPPWKLKKNRSMLGTVSFSSGKSQEFLSGPMKKYYSHIQPCENRPQVWTSASWCGSFPGSTDVVFWSRLVNNLPAQSVSFNLELSSVVSSSTMCCPSLVSPQVLTRDSPGGFRPLY